MKTAEPGNSGQLGQADCCLQMPLHEIRDRGDLSVRQTPLPVGHDPENLKRCQKADALRVELVHMRRPQNRFKLLECGA